MTRDHRTIVRHDGIGWVADRYVFMAAPDGFYVGATRPYWARCDYRTVSGPDASPWGDQLVEVDA